MKNIPHQLFLQSLSFQLELCYGNWRWVVGGLNVAALGNSSEEGKLWLINQKQGTPVNSKQLLEAVHGHVTSAHPSLQRCQRQSFSNPTS